MEDRSILDQFPFQSRCVDQVSIVCKCKCSLNIGQPRHRGTGLHGADRLLFAADSPITAKYPCYMTQKQAIQLFEERKVRTVWDDEAETWYFAIVDVVAILTESADAAAYWRKLKQRLKAEGNETVTNCHGLNPISSFILSKLLSSV